MGEILVRSLEYSISYLRSVSVKCAAGTLGRPISAYLYDSDRSHGSVGLGNRIKAVRLLMICGVS